MTTRPDRLSLKENPSGAGLVLSGLALLGVGVVMVFSASAGAGQSLPLMSRLEVRHIIYASIAAMVLVTAWRCDYRLLTRGGGTGRLATALLLVSLALAVIVLIPGIGAEFNGARRWLRIPLPGYTLSFQPSEILKISLVIYLACRLGREGVDAKSFTKGFLPSALLMLLCVGLVAIEDFGTGAIIGLTAVGVMAAAGVRWRYLLMLVPPAAGAFYVLVVQSSVRWARIVAFTDPWDVSNRFTWQLRQSLIAVGSGGLWGKGLGNGTVKLGFLPEDPTDFIFAVICEELGFFGAAVVLGLFGLFGILCWRVGTRSRCGVARLLACGVGLLVGIQALLHVAVNIGCAPPTGMNLPLVGAGGTALILIAAAVSLVVSASAHGHTLEGGPTS